MISLCRTILYWIVTGLYLIILFLSPFIIGKFINGGLMSLYIPFPVSGYIAGIIVTVATFGCLASKKFHGMLSRIDEEIRLFVLRA